MAQRQKALNWLFRVRQQALACHGAGAEAKGVVALALLLRAGNSKHYALSFRAQRGGGMAARLPGAGLPATDHSVQRTRQTQISSPHLVEGVQLAGAIAAHIHNLV